MRTIQLTIILIIGIFFTQDVNAQWNRTNISVQVGYQFKYFNPAPYNFAVERFNTTQTGLTKNLKEVKWNGGWIAGLGIHRRRTTLSLNVMTFFSDSHSIGPDSLGVSQRRDVSFNGEIISASMVSDLVNFGADNHFAVGAAFNLTHIKTSTAQVAEADYEKDDPLTTASNTWKPSFMIIAPFRFGITEQLQVSAEPYYQIFFNKTDFAPFSEAINGNTVPQNDPELGGELDHPGIILSLIVFLRRR